MSTTPQVETLVKIKSKQMVKLLSSGRRIDDRDPLNYREIRIENNVIDKAEGSALVSIGNTKVLVGIKIETGEPFPDTPDDAVLTVNAEFVPLAHKFFEPGPPDENSIELARVVDRALRGSKAVELEKLCITPKRLVYVIFVDVYILNHDGNLMDASMFATISALSNSKLPRYEIDEDGKPKKTDEYSVLPVRDRPTSTTMVKIGGKLLVDPTSEEENLADVRIIITITEDGKICAIQKSGSGTLSIQEILEAKRIARQKSMEVREKIYKQ